MTELTTLTQSAAGFAILVFGGIIALMIFARLAFFGMFFLAVPVAAAIGGARSSLRRSAQRHRAETGMSDKKGIPLGEGAHAPSLLEGIRMPRNLWYHPKHIWMKPEPDGAIRIGFDDFAHRLMGAIRQIDMLTLNVHHQMGKSGLHSLLKGWEIFCNGKSVRINSPVQGRVVDVNSHLGSEPSRISKDPYGEGWLCTIRPEKEADPLHAAISGDEVEMWMNDEVNRLRHYTSHRGIAVLQDGGELVPNPAEILSESEWQQLVKAFISA
jgi:glycine cleavage system H protein